MSISLYQLSDEYAYLLERLFDQESGEVNTAIAGRLDALEAPLQEKAINKVRFMKAIEAEHAAVKAEREAMAAREKSLKAKIDWFKRDLLGAMERSGINEISCPQFVIKLRKNPESVELDPDVILTTQFQRVTVEPNLEAIKFAIKGGMEIPGARLVQKHRIEIK